MFGEPRCKYEFGQCILSRVKEPTTKFAPRLQKVTFSGCAPNVTNGYFVLRADNRIELTSNIADEPVFDATSEPVEQPPRTSTEEPPEFIHDYPYTDKELEADMGPEGAGGWYWLDDSNKESTTGTQDDPMEVVSVAPMNKVTENLWQQEDIKPEENPERLQE